MYSIFYTVAASQNLNTSIYIAVILSYIYHIVVVVAAVKIAHFHASKRVLGQPPDSRISSKGTLQWIYFNEERVHSTLYQMPPFHCNQKLHLRWNVFKSSLMQYRPGPSTLPSTSVIDRYFFRKLSMEWTASINYMRHHSPKRR